MVSSKGKIIGSTIFANGIFSTKCQDVAQILNVFVTQLQQNQCQGDMLECHTPYHQDTKHPEDDDIIILCAKYEKQVKVTTWKKDVVVTVEGIQDSPQGGAILASHIMQTIESELQKSLYLDTDDMALLQHYIPSLLSL